MRPMALHMESTLSTELYLKSQKLKIYSKNVLAEQWRNTGEGKSEEMEHSSAE